jgi:GNAT superfamily N-acetyltransferase
MVDVRPATVADQPTLVALLVAQLREHRIDTPPAAIARAVAALLARPSRARLLVACVGGTPVGVAAVSFVWPLEHGDRSVWLEELYVVPAERGRGIGTALLEAALRVAAEGGAVAVDLEVDADHERAARLYARHGFQPLPRARWVRMLTPVPPAGTRRAEWTGGCFCGTVRYRIAAVPRSVSHCHCTICRRTTGAPFVTWATFPSAAVALEGTPAELRATARGVRTFCAACGTALTIRMDADPEWVDVSVGSLETPDDIVPESHIFIDDALAWLHIDDPLPRFPDEPAT